MKKLFIVGAMLSLSACASVTAGSNQSISVTTIPNTGASCQLSNDSGTWFVPSTPGSVMIKREASDMSVICTKGKESGTATVISTTKGLAFGNILAGGIIGAAVDRGTGAAFDYPALITVPISKTGSSVVIGQPKETPKKSSQTANPHAR